LNQYETSLVDLKTASEVFRTQHGEDARPHSAEEINFIDELVESVEKDIHQIKLAEAEGAQVLGSVNHLHD
jgi:hypothetical protein